MKFGEVRKFNKNEVLKFGEVRSSSSLKSLFATQATATRAPRRDTTGKAPTTGGRATRGKAAGGRATPGRATGIAPGRVTLGMVTPGTAIHGTVTPGTATRGKGRAGGKTMAGTGRVVWPVNSNARTREKA